MLLTGVIRCSTTMIARTVRLWTVAGTIVTSTRVAARVSLKMFLGATIACSTSVFTNLVTIGTKLISGIIACSTMLSMGNIGGLVTSIGRHIIKSATFQYSKAMERLHIKM